MRRLDEVVDRINRLEETNVCLRIKLQAVKIYVPNEVYIKKVIIPLDIDDDEPDEYVGILNCFRQRMAVSTRGGEEFLLFVQILTLC